MEITWCKFQELKRRWSGRQFLHETTLYIKRGQMERDLLLCMKRRERRERKKKSSRESDVSTIESANGPCELPVKGTKEKSGRAGAVPGTRKRTLRLRARRRKGKLKL